MAESHSTEKTFKSFTKDQGASYATHRRGYHPNLYQTVIEQHVSTGGKLDTILDVGCGPGMAVRDLAPQFARAVGIDPSEGMITNARSLGGLSENGEPIRFEIASAEDLGQQLSPAIEDGSVDLITAATAAHWFDMRKFWPAAARVLKPGGSVALWSTGRITIDPSMPNAAAIQAAMDEIEEKELVPFFEPGNILCRALYKDMPMPWTLTPPVTEFEKSALFRKFWGPENSDEFFVGGGMEVNLDTMELVLGTASPVQRWREAHPEAVGTENDVVKRERRVIERLLREAGVEEGKEMVKGSLNGVLFVLKKI